MRRVRVAQRVEARALRQLHSAKQQRHGRRNRVRLQWRAVGIREYQIQVDAIVRSELVPELILALAVCIQRRDRRHRQAHRARLLGLGAPEFEHASCLRERPRDHGATVLDVRPTERKYLAAASTRGRHHLQVHPQTPRLRSRFNDHSLPDSVQCRGASLPWAARCSCTKTSWNQITAADPNREAEIAADMATNGSARAVVVSEYRML